MKLSTLTDRRHGPGRKRTKGKLPPAAAHRKVTRALRAARGRDGRYNDRNAGLIEKLLAKQRALPPRPNYKPPKVKRGSSSDSTPSKRLASDWKQTPNSYKDCPHCDGYDVGQSHSGASRRNVETTTGRITVVTCNKPRCGKEFRL